jgi:hypothetical protein
MSRIDDANPAGMAVKRGRPRCRVTAEQVAELRNREVSWRGIGRALGISAATAIRLYRSLSLVGGVTKSQKPVPKIAMAPDPPQGPDWGVQTGYRAVEPIFLYQVRPRPKQV